jgi:hypothetical protein
MEEPINKKNIIYVFVILLLFFLFIYKGLILSGDEYLEEFNKFTDATKSIQTGMKKGGNVIAIGGNKKNLDSQHSALNKKLFEVLNNLENIKLNLGSSIHAIKTNDDLLIQSLSKYFNNTSLDELKEDIKKIKDNRDKLNVDSILDALSNNLEKLRDIANENI